MAGLDAAARKDPQPGYDDLVSVTLREIGLAVIEEFVRREDIVVALLDGARATGRFRESVIGMATSQVMHRLIPRLTDQDRCAQSRKPMDMIVQG
jgi:hypothetical protein